MRTSRWGLRPLVAFSLATLLLSACGGTADPGEPAGPGATSEEPDDADDGPGGADADADDDADADAGDPGGATDLPDVTVYFVRSNDSGIWVEPEVHQLDQPTEAVARAAMEILFAGDAYADGLSSAVPAGVQVLATNIVGRTLIVDVSAEMATHSAGSAEELAFAEQFAHTGAAFSTVDDVQLWIEDEPIDELWGHLDWSEPIEPDPFAVSPITFTHPPIGPDGTSVSAGAVTFRGEARVFEANFGIRLYDAAGALVGEDFVTASEGAPGRGTWEHTFTVTEPGSYTVEVEEDDPSDGEGRPPFLSERSFSVH